MESCIICYEDKDLLLNKCKYNCIFNIHQQCLDKMKELSNINCPICRNKIYKINFNNNYNNYYNYNNSLDLLFFPRLLFLGLLIILFIISIWIINLLKLIFKLFQFFF